MITRRTHTTPRPAMDALAATIVGWSALWYVAYAWVLLARLDLQHHPKRLSAAIAALVVFWLIAMSRPLLIALALLALLPLFGNHPGGRLMEAINLPLTASAAGLVVQARRSGLPAPAGGLWRAAGLYVAAALIALVPSIPGMMTQAAQLDHWPTALMDALTAPEDDPLYVLSSLVGVTLCVAWAAALAWRQPSVEFFRQAMRVLVYTFLVVVGIGIASYHGLIPVTDGYLLRIDPRRPDISGFQSIFWNPGWFAWYFVILFAMALGWLWSASARERRVLIPLMSVAYLYSFANPQRGGLVAVHVCLALAAVLYLRQTNVSRRARLALASAAGVVVAAVGLAYTLEYIPHTVGSSLFRLLATPEEAATSNSVRLRLWTVAFRMWRDAPLFGLGEGSFAWRFEDYAPPGSAAWTMVHGDAHNTWIQLLVTRGLFGVLSLAVLTYLVGRAVLFDPNKTHPPAAAARLGRRDCGISIACALALAGFLVYSTVQALFYLQAIQILFWFIVTFAAAHGDIRAEWLDRLPWRAVLVGLAVVALPTQTVVAVPLFSRAREVIARQPPGFYQLESDPSTQAHWRWSTGKGTLCVQSTAPTIDLQMATGDPRPDAYPRVVTIAVNERVADRFSVVSGAPVVRTIRMPVARRSQDGLSGAQVAPPAASSGGTFGECRGLEGDVRLTVDVNRTWSPLAVGVGTDPRTLGVQVFAPPGI